MNDNKECPTCKEAKSPSDFFRDKSKKDGLKYSCKACSSNKSLNYDKRSFKERFKECKFCERSLSAENFVYSHTQDDGLEAQCRTCRSWRARSSKPTIEQVTSYETLVDEVFRSSALKLSITYEETGKTLSELVIHNRSEFEQLCVIGFQKLGLGIKWKMPIWIHSSSIP